jgi:CheY-like chemotaxis protein
LYRGGVGPKSTGGSVKANQEKRTILLVEDDGAVRKSMSHWLGVHGYDVIEATNADEALSALRSTQRVDLVLTDLRMPGAMDGADLVRLVRAEFPFLKVVMVSARVPDAILRDSLDGHFIKPMLPSALMRHLQALLASPPHEGGCLSEPA